MTLDAAEHERRLKVWKSSISLSEAARSLGMRLGTFSAWAKAHGIDGPRRGLGPVIKNEEQRREAHEKGLVASKAAAHCGITADAYRQWARHRSLLVPHDMQLGPRAPRLFAGRKFEGAEWQYWAGFITADGYVCQRPDRPDSWNIAVGLSSRDSEHLRKLQTFCGGGSISAVPAGTSTMRDGTVIHSGESVRFGISSKALGHALCAAGVTPNKTKRLILGGIKESPHFWRGVLDGDGSLGLYKGRPSITLCGSESLLNQYLGFCANNGIQGTRHLRPHRGIFYHSLAGTYAQKLVALTYANATISLQRKAVTAQEIINWTPRRSITR